MPILITGASGFIGNALAKALETEGAHTELRALCQTPDQTPANGHVCCVAGDLRDPASLRRACVGIDTVFHCAGYAHAFSTPRAEEEKLHREINYEGAFQMAKIAAEAGVKCFVFLSSVKAMGEPGDACADETFDKPPETPYGRAKRDAEDAIHEIGQKTGMHTVCLRLAMVYGPGSRGNLERMARLVKRGLFPPLPETGNRRSLVYIDDVVRAIQHVARDPRAAGKTYIVADPDSYSGYQIYGALCRAIGCKPPSWAIPAFVWLLAGYLGDLVEKVVRRPMPLNSQVVERLLGSACYNPALIEKELGFRAQTGLETGLGYLSATH